MMDVCRNKVLAVLLASLVFTGCKEPEMQMSTLGKKLPAPSLKGDSPFDQDIYGLGYARIQGSCDTRVGTILVSFNKQIWHQPPFSPDLTGTALPAGTKNDTDCSDGQFDFYITKTDLTNIWGINTGPSGDNVDYIYVKGSSLIGDTDTLVLKDNDDSNNSGPASLVILEKSWPKGFGGSDQCGYFNARLTNSSGEHGATHSAPVSFQLRKEVLGATTDGIQAYASWDDCHNDTNPQTTFTIPQGQFFTDVIYRFPAAPIDGELHFSIINTSALTASPTKASVILRDSSYSSTRRWVNIEDFTSQIYKGKCYPLRLRLMNYNGSVAYDSTGGTLNLGANDARVKFYSDSSCGSQTSSLSFAPYVSELFTWIKYVPDGQETSQFSSFDISISGSAGSLQYDFSPLKIRLDLTSYSLATVLDMWGPSTIENGTCQPFRVASTNINGTVIPVNGPLTAVLQTKEAGVGAFYSDFDCQNPISQVAFAANDSLHQVYFRPSASTAGTFHFNVTSSGMTNRDTEFKVKSIARQLKFAAMNWTAGGCTPVSVGIADLADFFLIATKNYSININVYGSVSMADKLYSDAQCSVTKADNLVSIGTGMGAGVFYIKTDGLSGQTLSIEANDNGGTLSGTLMDGTFF